MDAAPRISIVVPLFNEQAVFESLKSRLVAVLDSTLFTVEVILVDDGSGDETPLLARLLAQSDTRFQTVILSRNHGHQLAVSAGLKSVRATEAVFIIDGDLQDPPELLTQFYQKLKQGYDVVYGVRKKRKENVFKRFAYSLFYRLLKRISYIHIPLDSGDFSMISKKVVQLMNQMPEESRFLRGMRSWVGFKQFGFEYERDERLAGDSKYTLKKLVQLAFMGIFNFSEFPIHFVTRLGLLTITGSLFYLAYNIYKKFVLHAVPEGFTAILFTVILFGGMQLLAIGLIGEYVLRIFFQVKGRPLFIVSEHWADGKKQETLL